MLKWDISGLNSGTTEYGKVGKSQDWSAKGMKMRRRVYKVRGN
jgi:hypothetical protein